MPNEPAPRILVADDNVQLLALLTSILESAGYEVTACEGGAPALAAAREREFDVVMLDLMMPDIDGFEICEAVREAGPNRATPIVFLTGMVDESTYEDAVAAGADEVLAKPLNRSSVLLRLRSLRRLNEMRGERDREQARLRAAQRERAELTELLLVDLEQPLNVMRARAGTLSRTLGLSPELAEATADVLRAQESLEEVARMLMDVHRSTEGRFRAYPEELDLGALVRSVAAAHHARGRAPAGRWRRGSTRRSTASSSPWTARCCGAPSTASSSTRCTRWTTRAGSSSGSSDPPGAWCGSPSATTASPCPSAIRTASPRSPSSRRSRASSPAAGG